MDEEAHRVDLSEYLKTRAASYDVLVRNRLVGRELIREFKELEAAMNGGGMLGNDYVDSYHYSDDRYKRHLEKVVVALKQVGEPHAEEKYRAVVEELAVMAPAIYYTPWEITLSYLDEHYGNFEDVRAFYKRNGRPG